MVDATSLKSNNGTSSTQSASDYETGLNDDDQMDLRVWLRLLTCANLIERTVRKNLRDKFDTTLPRFDILAQIDRTPDGQPMRELSKRIMVTNGNLTPLIDRLIEDDLVERNPSEQDRRVQHVNLTNEGKASLDEMIPEHNKWISSMMSNLDHDQASMLYNLLGELKESILEAEKDAS